MNETLNMSGTTTTTTINNNNNEQQQDQSMTTPTITTHLIVLIHGLMGNAKSLLYLEQTIIQLSSEYNHNNHNHNNQSRWIIHTATSNINNTLDGIEAGGTRLANEVNVLLTNILNTNNIQNENNNNNNNTGNTSSDEKENEIEEQTLYDTNNNNKRNHVVTLSLIGNSLGGLYARYALSKINWQYTTTNNTVISVYPAIFCTLVTPYLGVQQNTYMRFPRFLEWMIAITLRQTGYDLFRCNNDLLDQMIINDIYTIPLQNFYHRILYANAYNTDSQVPFRTAAFVSNTNSIHYIINSISSSVVRQKNAQQKQSTLNDLEVENESEKQPSFVSLQVQTKQIRNLQQHKLQQQQEADDEQPMIELDSELNKTTKTKKKALLSLDEMAIALDAFGWTKVFCDLRPTLSNYPILIPSCNNCCSCTTKDTQNDMVVNPLSKNSQHCHDEEAQDLIVLPTITKNKNDNNTTQTQELQNENLLSSISNNIIDCDCYTTSYELLKQYNHNDDKYRWYVPFGHQILVANSKTEWISKLTVGGRPMVHQIANDIINNIIKATTNANQQHQNLNSG